MFKLQDERPSGGVHVPAALLVAHPGHELRLAQWVAETRPCLFILTDGSRSLGQSTRVEASRELALGLGATVGAVFGRHSDREVYGWILAGDPEPFVALARELADCFVQRRLHTVVVDAWQLYNVSHDLWHLTVRAAARLASRRLPWPIETLDFEVVPTAMAQCGAGPARKTLQLSETALARKIQLVEAYPEISGDVADVLAGGGPAFLEVERLNAPPPLGELWPRIGERPLYETYGEARVRAGLYREVLRWAHVEPIASTLAALVSADEVAA